MAKAKLRYRKVSVRMWGDEKFRRLSAPQPNGRTLWFYLLTGPESGVLPGLIVTGEAGLAEALGWPLGGFRKAFEEVLREGMVEVDWPSRVVWVPKAVAHNPPQSTNVIKAWAEAFQLVPDCGLKWKALAGMKAFVETMQEGFQRAFQEAFQEAMRYPGAVAVTGAVTGMARVGSLPESLSRDGATERPLDAARRIADRWAAHQRRIDPKDPIVQEANWPEHRESMVISLCDVLDRYDERTLTGALDWGARHVGDGDFSWRAQLDTPENVVALLAKGKIIRQYQAAQEAATRAREGGHGRNPKPEPPAYPLAAVPPVAPDDVPPPLDVREKLRRVAGAS